MESQVKVPPPALGLVTLDLEVTDILRTPFGVFPATIACGPLGSVMAILPLGSLSHAAHLHLVAATGPRMRTAPETCHEPPLVPNHPPNHSELLAIKELQAPPRPTDSPLLVTDASRTKSGVRESVRSPSHWSLGPGIGAPQIQQGQGQETSHGLPYPPEPQREQRVLLFPNVEKRLESPQGPSKVNLLIKRQCIMIGSRFSIECCKGKF